MFYESLIVAALVCQSPVGDPPPADVSKVTLNGISAQRKADLDKQVAKKKSAALKAASYRSAKAAAEYKRYQDQLAYEAKMAPTWAQQARDNAHFSIEAAKAQGMLMLGDAAEKEVLINAKRLQVEQRKVGVPFIPTQTGMQPYPFAAGGGNP